jgi:homocysteine S-methyltransferase
MGASVYRRGFRDRLAAGPPLLLDGATGTELERRGARCDLPLWSARALVEAPDLVERIHREYAAAGAEVVTADTFRTQARSLSRGGFEGRAFELTALAVSLARRALGEDGFVAGSMAPLEDCWRPDLVPDDGALAREHGEHAANLAEAGADLLLIETQNTIREARAATVAAQATGLPVWVCFACDGHAQLGSGETLAAALAAIAPLAPDGVGVNCLPPAFVPAALVALRDARLPFSVHANLGHRGAHDATPAAFAGHALAWVRAGARMVGGCCGTTPEHTRATAAAIRARG